MNKIPRFSGAELQDIANLLSRAGLTFEFQGTTVGASAYGATTEYYILVDDASYIDACALLMDYYGIDSGTDEPFDGSCPACGATVSGSIDCPDCGLHFGFGTPEHLKQHPFYKFLENNSLLPEDSPS